MSLILMILNDACATIFESYWRILLHAVALTKYLSQIRSQVTVEKKSTILLKYETLFIAYKATFDNQFHLPFFSPSTLIFCAFLTVIILKSQLKKKNSNSETEMLKTDENIVKEFWGYSMLWKFEKWDFWTYSDPAILGVSVFAPVKIFLLWVHISLISTNEGASPRVRIFTPSPCSNWLIGTWLILLRMLSGAILTLIALEFEYLSNLWEQPILHSIISITHLLKYTYNSKAQFIFQPRFLLFQCVITPVCKSSF